MARTLSGIRLKSGKIKIPVVLNHFEAEISLLPTYQIQFTTQLFSSSIITNVLDYSRPLFENLLDSLISTKRFVREEFSYAIYLQGQVTGRSGFKPMGSKVESQGNITCIEDLPVESMQASITKKIKNKK